MNHFMTHEQRLKAKAGIVFREPHTDQLLHMPFLPLLNLKLVFFYASALAAATAIMFSGCPSAIPVNGIAQKCLVGILIHLAEMLTWPQG